MPFLPSTPAKPRAAVMAKRTTVALPRSQPRNTGPLPPGMGSPRPPMSPGMPRGPIAQNTGPLPPGMPGKRPPVAAMAEGGKAKKAVAKKKLGKK